MEPTPEALQIAKQHVVFAARAAGILPLGVIGSMADFGDEAAFKEMVRRSRRFGFSGASCIHPAQVPILNALFAPSQEEVDAARRIVDALAAAEKDGRGAVALDGRMIDAPVAESARRTLQRQCGDRGAFRSAPAAKPRPRRAPKKRQRSMRVLFVDEVASCAVVFQRPARLPATLATDKPATEDSRGLIQPPTSLQDKAMKQEISE
jgi:hypothetical protein